MSGKIKNTGRKSCSIRELAAHIGLSTCTVSKVLNDRAGKKIPKETQERVLAAARELNYVPNVNAQRLFQRRSGVIGLLVPARPIAPGNVFGDSHFVDILSGMEPLLEESGHHLMLLFRNEERRPDETYARLFRAGTIDGLLIWGTVPESTLCAELEADSLPYLFITCRPPDLAPEAVNWVASDYRASAREVTSAMLRAGCRKLLYLAGPENSSVAAEMRRGVDDALAGTGVGLSSRSSLYTPGEARKVALDALRREPFDGILNVSRDMAPGILDAAAELGLDGGNFRMATIDCAASRPRLSCELATGLADDLAIGRAAIESLLELIGGKTARVGKRIPGCTVLNPRFFPEAAVSSPWPAGPAFPAVRG